jgi:hypothetical protein
LSVQIANSKERRPRPTNQRTNIWCTNCGGHGHLPTECSTRIGNKNNLRCSYYKGKGHDVTTCWNLSDVRNVVTSNNQWTEQAKNNYKINSKQPFTRPNVEPPYKPNDGRPRWNDTYNVPPNWNGPPTNPNNFRYGPPEKGKHIVCYRCGELEHYANNCPNLQKEEGYTPYCGRCRKPGHVVEECRASQPAFPPSERDYSQGKQVQFQQDEPKASRNVHHVTQLTFPKTQDVYITRSAARAKQALRENNQESSFDSKFTGPQVKQKPSSIEKHLKKIPLQQPLIPPSIDTFKEPIVEPLQEPLDPLRINKEPLKLPIQVKELVKEPDSLTPPIESIPPLERPTFYRPPKKVSKDTEWGWLLCERGAGSKDFLF